MRCDDLRELPILVNAIVVSEARRPAPRHPHRRLRCDGAPGLRATAPARSPRRRGVRGTRARAAGCLECVRRRDLRARAGRMRSSRAPSTALRASSAAVLLADGTGPLELIAGDETALELFDAGLGALAEQAIGSGEIVTVADLDQAAAILPGLDDALHGRRLTALSIAPLRTDGRVSGVVVSLFARDRVFDTDSREIQAALARQAGQVLAPRPPPGGARAPARCTTSSPGSPTASCSRSGSTPPSPPPPAADGRSPSCSSTSTASRRSTTASATASATTCSSRSPRDSARWRARATRSPGTAVTSSSSSARTPRRRPAANIAERFRQAVRRPLDSVPPRYAIAASIGVAVWDPAKAPDAGHRPSAAHRRRGDVRFEGRRPGSRHDDDDRQTARGPTQHSTTTSDRRPAWEH